MLYMKTILVIEHEPPLRKRVAEILHANGFSATVATDGLEGLQQARDATPDLIIADVQLPKLDGHALLQCIRQDPQLAAIPVILLGTKGGYRQTRRAMELGADDFLARPVIPEDLLSAIAACFRRQANLGQSYAHQVQRVQVALDRMAHWDEVTSLPNRRLFCQQIQQVMLQARQAQHSVAVFYLSINQLSAITVTFGQELGDALLRLVSERLKQVDALAIARLGEAQFGLVLADNWQHQQVNHIAQRLTERVTQPYTLNGQEICIQVSLGIASYPQHGSNPVNLLTRARTALRWCQDRGHGGYRFYNPTMSAIETERQLIATDLGRAIARQELELYYQPQVDVVTGQLIGLEALLRWQHPARGMISPTTFIPIAEELGLIVPIGEWVLRTACLQFHQWQQEHRQPTSPMKLSVNLSILQLQQRHFAATVASILQETGLHASGLQLELTESCLMKQINTTMVTLQQLKQLGVGLSIDDFGTGYSSLTYLSRLPIDALKIDHTFVQQLTLSENAAVISNAIIGMAQRLNLEVVAEGVENQGQLLFLHQIGCRTVQGFVFAPPLTVDQVQQLLRRGQHFPQILTSIVPSLVEPWSSRPTG
jgi:diguanylate cyclase (GGDEF)-like protein